MISGANDCKRPGYRRERQGAIGSKRVDMLWIWRVYSSGDKFWVMVVTFMAPNLPHVNLRAYATLLCPSIDSSFPVNPPVDQVFGGTDPGQDLIDSVYELI